jgi:hypothetical protein
MTRVTITKVERDPRGFWTAHVSDGETTITVDNRIGPWTAPHDPRADHGSNRVRRHEVMPEVATRLRARVRAAERGDHGDDNIEVVIERGGGTRNVPAPPAPKPAPPAPAPEPDDRSRTARIAQRMAQAGLAAVKKKVA